ncbi:hypothetical protein AAY473_002183 [Plecturocebus cupreus]
MAALQAAPLYAKKPLLSKFRNLVTPQLTSSGAQGLSLVVRYLALESLVQLDSGPESPVETARWERLPGRASDLPGTGVGPLKSVQFPRGGARSPLFLCGTRDSIRGAKPRAGTLSPALLRMESCCYPGWSAMVRPQFTATSTSRVQARM